MKQTTVGEALVTQKPVALVTRKVCVLNFVWDTESKNEMEAGTEPEVAEADLSEMLRIPYLFQRRYLYTWLPLDLVTIITLALATEAGTELEVANADLGEKLRIRYLIQRRYLHTWFPPGPGDHHHACLAPWSRGHAAPRGSHSQGCDRAPDDAEQS